MKLSGKTAVVSGGNGGIGSALVRTLHQQGVTVYSLDVNGASSAIPGVHYLSADLTHPSQLQQALSTIDGKVDILISSTGAMRRGTIFDSSEEDYDLLFDANVKTAWMLLKYIKPLLVEDAMVVQVSSSHALHTEANPGLYSLTKKTTAALAEMVTITCPSYKVKVVYPGPVLTNLLLTGRSEFDRERISKIAMKPDDFAPRVIELMSSDKKTLRFIPDTFGYEIV